MTPELKAAIQFACMKAMQALGGNYKGMSCFLYSWQSPLKKVGDDGEKAA